MAAVTRWVEYSSSAAASVGTGGGTQLGKGTRAFAPADSDVKSTLSDDGGFNITSSSNRLWLQVYPDGSPSYITLHSGTGLDPRFVAKDITEKMHAAGKGTVGWDQAQCVWTNDDSDAKLIIYSGQTGSSSSITVSSGTDTAHLELGFGTSNNQGGSNYKWNGDNSLAETNNYLGGITVSGTYRGFFDETYRIIINKEVTTPGPTGAVKGGSNSYNGTITVGGMYSYPNDGSSTETYSIEIDTSNGQTMGARSGNVPTMSWDTTNGNDDGGPIELLYPDYWYKVGTRGLMVKFTDAVFNTVTAAQGYAWTIDCEAVTEASAGSASSPVGTAKFVWSSNRGDDATSAVTTVTSGSWAQLGTRGLYVQWGGAANDLDAGDEFHVVCTPPQPEIPEITLLNYGNVTVSTESPVKAVMFEIMSGAVQISTVKFGLQNHGSFVHHESGNSDTLFRFGTVGPTNNGYVGAVDGIEWWENVVPSDIDSTSNPTYLYATDGSLSVVSDADSSEAVGASTYAGMCSDPIWLCIKLGVSEVGANSTINYRLYFDYS